MPFNMRLGREYRLGGWFSGADVQIVAGKNVVSVPRYEQITDGYVLLNLKTGYEWTNVRLDLGVQNVTNTLYTAPLGGFYSGATSASAPTWGVPGDGPQLLCGSDLQILIHLIFGGRAYAGRRLRTSLGDN